MLLVGAVDIAGTLRTLAKAMGWRPYVIDPSARFATRDRLGDADDVLSVWPAEAFERLGGIDPATSIIAEVVAVRHGHQGGGRGGRFRIDYPVPGANVARLAAQVFGR